MEGRISGRPSGGGRWSTYIDIAVPNFIARGGRTGSVVPSEFAAVFNCAEDGVLLLELSPHRKKQKVSQSTTSDVSPVKRKRVK